MKPITYSGAVISDCKKYRYSLWRVWDLSKPHVLFIGLNPSTADATEDDPTIRRCIRFARDWGYGGLYMANLFAYRATSPKDMKQVKEPEGPDNFIHLSNMVNEAAIVVAAWGTHGHHRSQDRVIMTFLSNDKFHCLGVTKDGMPRHPLYIKADTKPQPFHL